MALMTKKRTARATSVVMAHHARAPTLSILGSGICMERAYRFGRAAAPVGETGTRKWRPERPSRSYPVRVRYLRPLPGIVLGPPMVGIGIYFLVQDRIALGVWVLSLGVIVVAAIIWALCQPGGWWQPNPWDREYWDPDRRDPDSS